MVIAEVGVGQAGAPEEDHTGDDARGVDGDLGGARSWARAVRRPRQHVAGDAWHIGLRYRSQPSCRRVLNYVFPLISNPHITSY